jgi:probable O-glycosylation ligase (exosortase A-associated)
MVCVGASILGSQSRGALLGLLAMAFMLGLKSKHPVRFSLGLLVLIGAGIAFMPDSWTQRMDTIQAYNADDSAMSRLYTWRTLWNVALERPLVGAGFRADNLALFERYAPRDAQYASFQGLFWVAHSIYFQALGEHGFVGLFLYLFLWAWCWVAAGRTARRAEAVPGLQDWAPLLMRMCQVSTIGFCTGGAFLSLMNADLPLYILAFVTLCRCAVDDELVASAAVRPAGAAAPGAPLGAGSAA